MIIVEVYAVSLEKTYEFKLNEDIAVHVVTDEISSLICQKEQCMVRGERGRWLLVLRDRQQILSANLSLYENGVQSGDKLMLV